jgi:hypothetical protein
MGIRRAGRQRLVSRLGKISRYELRRLTFLDTQVRNVFYS